MHLGEGRLVSSSADATVRIWDTNSKKMLTLSDHHKSYVYGVSSLENNSKIVSASKDRSVHVIDANTMEHLGQFEHADGCAHHSTVYDVNTLGFLVITASRDGYAKIWDSRNQKLITVVDPEDGFVYSADFLPNGNVVLGTAGKTGRKNTSHLVVCDFRGRNSGIVAMEETS